MTVCAKPQAKHESGTLSELLGGLVQSTPNDPGHLFCLVGMPVPGLMLLLCVWFGIALIVSDKPLPPGRRA